ncbi:hypothetical protein KPL78_05910 [Roseomonas sp. HJA6]|uniref:DUF2842 domain-containing protein n=1 Tax=Roseomonas alba TaxID=2846776 RepID=A0ABS7A4Y1_9PROT|nr:hypothetical protein [Neoroseomonas alba]MBW6397376.1 hypothetical protein [Neoroseomonas alba]
MARLIRLLFWALQGLVLLGIAMVVVGLVIEDASPGAPILKVLVLPVGLLPVLGPVWVVATPVLLILMLLTRSRRSAGG